MAKFLDLPVEIRAMIYQELATSVGLMRLREHSLWSDVIGDCDEMGVDWQYGSLENGPVSRDHVREFMKLSRPANYECDYAAFEVFSGAPILQCSRQIRKEAEGEFLCVAPIHFSIRSHLPLDLGSLPWLAQVKHLSVDYSFLSWGSAHVRHEQEWSRTDRDIAAFINMIPKVCEFLRTFTLHILSDRCCNLCHWDFMLDALETYSDVEERESEKATAEALTGLVPKVRDLITIVAFGIPHSYSRLRRAISPSQSSGFAHGRLDKWPSIKLNSEQRAANDSLWQFYTSHAPHAAIYAWHFKMPTSKVRDCHLVPEWPFLHRHQMYIRDRDVSDRRAVLLQEDNLEQTLSLRADVADLVS